MDSDQRQFPRVALNAPLRFQVKTTSKFGSTVSRDISEGGIRFLSEDFVPIGTSMVLEVNLGNVPKYINAVADVVWAQKIPHSERYQLGLKFCEIDEPYYQDIREYVRSRLA
jgi:c-di-GMP-binding flagellar brake protein YcgR